MSKLNILVNSLELLSLSYDKLKLRLPEFISADDNIIQEDIIDDFENAFMLLPRIMEENRIPYLALIKIIDCYCAVNLIATSFQVSSRNLEDGSICKRVRILAKEALEILGGNGPLIDVCIKKEKG